MKTKFLILLFELGFFIKFNLVGEISISELYLIFTATFFLKKINWSRYKELKTINKLYVTLFCSQIISELFVSNGLDSSLKGLAITVVSYLHFMFLYRYLIKDKSLILVLIFSVILGKIFFGTDIADASADELLEGQAATYLKFYIAPLIIQILLLISLLSTNKYISFLFVFTGLLFVILGARSSGVMVFLTGLVSYMIEHKTIVRNKTALLMSLIVVIIVGYWGYTIYVDKVLAGEITSGNSSQLLDCENPYNPFELLKRGRTEAWVGWQAFLDKPLFGHGAWAYDYSGKYVRMMSDIRSQEFKGFNQNTSYLVPAHSVLIGTAMMNGVFAFVCMLSLVVFFVKNALKSIKYVDKRYIIISISYFFSLLWTMMFSPSSHFRLSMPVFMSVLFVMYLTSDKSFKQTSRNGNEDIN